MNRIKYDKKSQHSVYNIIFRAVGILLTLTMLSLWLVSGIFAKYVIAYPYSDAANVAGTGAHILLLEHEASLENGIYTLDTSEEVTANTYEKVIPGVDIAKDPFIRLNIDSAVQYELYIKVIESNPFPDTVTYDLTDDWEPVAGSTGVYKYKNVLNTQTTDTIKILKNDKLTVSEHYVGNSQTFTLGFSAWLVQANAD